MDSGLHFHRRDKTGFQLRSAITPKKLTHVQHVLKGRVSVYWYQARRANELFQALDGNQRKIALRTDPRDENKKETVALPHL